MHKFLLKLTGIALISSALTGCLPLLNGPDYRTPEEKRRDNIARLADSTKRERNQAEWVERLRQTMYEQQHAVATRNRTIINQNNTIMNQNLANTHRQNQQRVHMEAEARRQAQIQSDHKFAVRLQAKENSKATQIASDHALADRLRAKQ